MSRTLFENSKAALAFAAITIFGAASMVGTSDNGGVLSALVERFGTMPEDQASAEQVSSETPSKDAKPAGEGWGSSSPTSVFGDFSGKPPASEESGESGEQGGNPMTAPLAPTAIVNNSPPSGFFASGSEEPPPAE